MFLKLIPFHGIYSCISHILYWMKTTLWKVMPGLDIFLYKKSALKVIIFFESLSCKVIKVNTSDFKHH